MYQPSDNAKKSYNKQDLCELIGVMLHTPLTEKQQTVLDGSIPMNALKGKCVDVQTAIAIRMANQAMGGDVKSADWLGKYGGLEPPKKQEVKMELPNFYMGTDNLPDDVKAALALESNDCIEEEPDGNDESK